MGNIHGEIIPLIGEGLRHPFEIWVTPQKNEAGRIRLSRRYIGFWKTRDRQRIAGLFVYEVVHGELVGVTAYIPMRRGKYNLAYAERQRK